MIISWRHKGLKLFFETGKVSGIQVKHAGKIRLQLAVLHAAEKPEDLNLPGYRFHQLRGTKKDYYSITVSGNWRITFKFEAKNAIFVNYEDYH